MQPLLDATAAVHAAAAAAATVGSPGFGPFDSITRRAILRLQKQRFKAEFLFAVGALRYLKVPWCPSITAFSVARTGVLNSELLLDLVPSFRYFSPPAGANGKNDRTSDTERTVPYTNGTW